METAQRDRERAPSGTAQEQPRAGESRARGPGAVERQRLRRLPGGRGGAAEQLAAGAALVAGLEHSGVAAERWFHIDGPALLLGSSQRPHEVDQAACAAAGAALYRRASGGGVVLADETLLLHDLALPREHPLYLADVTESYRWLGEVWARALAALGLKARVLAIQEARADTAALSSLERRICFAGRSPYEVLVEDRKVVGLAQSRRRPGALFQSGVYLRWRPERSAALVDALPVERAALAERIAGRVAGLEELCGREVAAAEVSAALEQALRDRAGFEPHDDAWLLQELAAAAEAAPRFAPVEG